MKLGQDKLNELAEKAHRTNALFLRAQDYLRCVNLPDQVADDIEAARRNVTSIGHGLVILGADDPQRRQTRLDREREGRPSLETPIHLLSSEKAQRAARALQAAAAAVLEMEEERGVTDGMGEMLQDWSDILEMEVFGPRGLGERE